MMMIKMRGYSQVHLKLTLRFLSKLPVHKALPSADSPKQDIRPSCEFCRDPKFKTTCSEKQENSEKSKTVKKAKYHVTRILHVKNMSRQKHCDTRIQVQGQNIHFRFHCFAAAIVITYAPASTANCFPFCDTCTNYLPKFPVPILDGP